MLRAFAREGSGFDIVSGGELFRALRAGADPAQDRLRRASARPRRDARRARGRHPDVQRRVGGRSSRRSSRSPRRSGGARRSPCASTPTSIRRPIPTSRPGMKKSKFGIDIGAALAVYERAMRSPHLEVIGVDCHIGSQLTTIEPFVDALARVRELVGAAARARRRDPLSRHRRRRRHHLSRRAAADARRVRAGGHRRHPRPRRHRSSSSPAGRSSATPARC